MYFDLRIGGKERIEQVICLINLGLLSALENDLLTIEEAEVYLYSPYSVSRLRETGVDVNVVELIQIATDLEDIARLHPHWLQQEILAQKEQTFQQLTLYEESIQPFAPHDEWGHFLEVRFAGTSVQIERSVLLVYLGIVTAFEQDLWSVEDIHTYLFAPDIMGQLQELCVDPRVLQLITETDWDETTPAYSLVDRTYRLLSQYLMLEPPEEKWIKPTPTHPLPPEFAGDILHGGVIHDIQWDWLGQTLTVVGLFVEANLEFHVQFQGLSQFHVKNSPLDQKDDCEDDEVHQIIVMPEPDEYEHGLPFVPNLIVNLPNTTKIFVKAERMIINGVCYLLDVAKEPPE